MKLFSKVILPVFLIIYISIDTYGKLSNNPLCTLTGCSLAEELLKFNSIYLNYFGILGGVLMAIFGYMSLKKRIYEKLFYITLFSAIAFESIMISYQIIANPEPCIFCLGVYATLIVTALLSHYKYLLYATPAIVALFVSMNLLTITKNNTIIQQNGIYLIGSNSCPHCQNIKKYFKEKNISYNNISIQKNLNAKFFIKQLGINIIPVVVVQQNSISTVIRGDKAIIDYFDQQNSKKAVDTLQINSSTKTDNHPALNQEDGCLANAVQDTECSTISEVPIR